MTVIGVLLLEADHSVETVGWEDPYSWVPPAGLGKGFFGHPGFWGAPTVFAVARNATGTTSAFGTAEAIQGVVDAIGRLDGHCDLIVGGCGYFGDAWAQLARPPRTFTVLSALDVLDDTLRSTAADVLVLSASTAAGVRAIAHHREAARIRVLGLDGIGEWSHFGRTDWATAGLITEVGIEAGLRTKLAEAALPGGLLDGVGAVIVECTVLPHYRATIGEYTSAPIIDLKAMVEALY